MRLLVPILAILLALPGFCQSNPAQNTHAVPDQKYAGAWWSAASADERSGFINGLSDCLTWAAHKPGFNETPEQLVPKISRFYQQHPKSKNLSLFEVWQRISKAPTSKASQDSGGEVWKNPHWYLDSGWWNQNSSDGKTGFVKGYLWCMDTQVVPQVQTYSHSADFYVKQINSFIDRNPKSEPKPIADILALYADKQAPTPN